MFDVDMSSTSVYATGVAGLTITGAGPGGIPGKLYFPPSPSGVYYLKLKNNTNIAGTNHLLKAQLVANSGGTLSDNTPFPYDTKAVIDFIGGGTEKLDAQYLDIKTVCTNPNTKYIETYGYCYNAVFNSGTGFWTLNGNNMPPVNGAPVYLSVDNSGVLPSGFDINTKYFTRDFSNYDCKLSATYNGSPIASNSNSVSGVYLHYGKFEVVAISGSYFILDGAISAGYFGTVKLRGAVLPSGIDNYDMFWPYNTSDRNIQLTYTQSQPKTLYTPADSGVGPLYLYGGSNIGTNTNKMINTVQDITTDPQWQRNQKVALSSSYLQVYMSNKIIKIYPKFIELESVYANGYGPCSLLILADRNVAIRTVINNFQGMIDFAHSGCSFNNEFYNSVGGYCYCFNNGQYYTVNGGIINRMGYDVTGGAPNANAIFNNVIITGNYGGVTGTNQKIKNLLCSGNRTVFGSTSTNCTLDDNSVVIGQANVCNSAINTAISGIFCGLSTGVFVNSVRCYAGGSIIKNCAYLDYAYNVYNTYDRCEVKGLDAIFYSSDNIFSNGSITYCTQIFNSYSSFNIIYNTILNNNSIDVSYVKNNFGYGVHHSGVLTSNYYKYSDVVSYNPYSKIMFYDSPSPGYISCYNFGGYTHSETYSVGIHGTPPITPPTCVHKTVTENAVATPSFVVHAVEIPLWCAKNQAMTVKIYIKQVSTGFDERAKFDLVNLSVIEGNNGGVISTATVADDTNWQTLVLIAPARSAEGPLTLRLTTRGINKSLYWFQTVEPAITITNSYLLI
jgi:hypothetical protein